MKINLFFGEFGYIENVDYYYVRWLYLGNSFKNPLKQNLERACILLLECGGSATLLQRRGFGHHLCGGGRFGDNSSI